MRKFFIPLCLSLVLFSCDEEDMLTDDTSNDTEETVDEIIDEESDETEVVSYEAEVFEDLTTADFTTIDTPYETELSALTSARTSETADDLAALLTELFGATLIDHSEGQARGLSVYIIKSRLDDGTIVIIKVVKDIFEILSIEAIPSGEITQNVSVEGFISLTDAITTATGLVDGSVVRWEISLEENNVLEFEIHIVATDGTRYEIELDAVTGDVLAQKVFENEEDVTTFEEEAEEENPEISTDMVNAVATFINADILYVTTAADAAGNVTWEVLVETSSEALVHLTINSTSLELVEAYGEDGPFDYDMSFVTDGVSFANQLKSVEGQMGITVDRWTYGSEMNGDLQYMGLTYFSTDSYGNETTVRVDAASGEWVESKTTPSEAFMTQLNQYVAITIEYAYFYDNDGSPFWDISGQTAAGATIKLLINEGTYVIKEAYHDDTVADVDYEFNFGGSATINLSQAKTTAAGAFDSSIVVFDWTYYNSLDVDGTSYSVLLLSVADDFQNFYTVYIDVVTGDIIKNQSNS